MQYLEAMGIESFVPRKVLPAAALSTQALLPIEWVDESSDLAPSVAAIVESRVERNSPMRAQTLVNDWMVKTQVSAPTEIATNLPVERTLQQILLPNRKLQLRFSLSVWQLANGVVLVDSRELRGALPTSTLFANILFALAPDLLLPKPDLIHWPLLEGATESPNALLEAREMTQAFLQSRFELAAPRLIVAMGAMAANLLAHKEGSEAGQLFEVTHWPCPVLILPSLAECLRQPLLKRHFWPTLKPWFNHEHPQ